MPTRPNVLSPRLAAVATILLAIVGIQAWLILGNGDFGHRHEIWVILGSVIAAFIGPLRRGVDRIWETIRQPPTAARYFVAVLLAIGSSFFLLWMQFWQHSNLRLFFHDEFSYALQMRMLAHGRLWMPPLPLPDFFDSFYILVRPVYGSMYFPGTALLYLPVIWLHLPFYVGPIAACGLCTSLVYLIFCEILDGACAALAVLMLLSISMFRLMSIMLLSEAPMLLMGLLMVFIYLRWRGNISPAPGTHGEGMGGDSSPNDCPSTNDPHPNPLPEYRESGRNSPARRNISPGMGWTLALGAAAGWAAIIRPADALCFALAIGVSMLFDLARKRRFIWLTTAILLFAGALPFLGTQLVFNRGVTGHWFYTPFSFYTDQNFPGGGLGFHAPPVGTPHVSDVPQKQYFFESSALKLLRNHRIADSFSLARGRLMQITASALPDAFLWILIPLAALSVWDRRQWALWGALPLFVIVYTAYPWTIPYYATPLFPAVILLVLSPIHWLGERYPTRRAALRTGIGLCIAILCITSWPQFDRQTRDQNHHMSALIQIDQEISEHVQPPAIVLFHFDARLDNPEEEPVYNSSVAWPDDAAIIRAHDRNLDPADAGKPGDADAALYEYYARLQPGRMIYLYDRRGHDPVLTRLGTAAEMLQRTTAH